MQFKQVKLTKVKSHCSQVNVLSKMYAKKQRETEFHIKAYPWLTHYKKKRGITKRKGDTVDDVLKLASHGKPIQHEILQKLFW
jgi:site-specific recombinase XerC